MADLYLASRSPRRRDLLRQIGVRFEPLLLRLQSPRGPDVEEIQQPNETPDQYVERMAREKVLLGLNVLSMRTMLGKPVLAADTVVSVDGEVIGKPISPPEAAAYLRRLSGRTHEVRTSVALATPSGRNAPVAIATSVTRVTFRTLEPSEIERYCATAEPYDKAGGYAIQGQAAVFIERIEGSYSGVVGLPLFETAQLLKRAGIAVL
jgi:septum formation protein